MSEGNIWRTQKSLPKCPPLSFMLDIFQCANQLISTLADEGLGQQQWNFALSVWDEDGAYPFPFYDRSKKCAERLHLVGQVGK